ncbi:FMN-binding protein [Oscillochloris sp. ZM17-4]|uniref:FMN-binding protein n=1 Tax=Oscillochloris sp. ZM17-4 TaxID=2866714 RepID=UPI001C735DC5|nr:FMN-binding protein [Oscillochloris sp. ZM17-4]MBX0330875.1 FMN-binding protein [Oscillochloris sp. ZM17-4]
MSQRQSSRPSPLLRAVKKYSVSAFVVCSFTAYAVHERMLGADAAALAAASQAPSVAVAREVPMPPTLTPAPRQIAGAAPGVTPSPMQIAAPRPTAAPAMLPPAPPTAAPAVALGPYKDGEYTGPVVDAYFGNVQVKATIQNGQLADVSFLDFPNHRRTSVRINNYAMPYLTSEAIQVQSARVNVISGATLTSEAFAESLQAALSQARS